MDRARGKSPVLGVADILTRVAQGDRVTCGVEGVAVSGADLSLGFADEVLDLGDRHLDWVLRAVGRNEHNTASLEEVERVWIRL